MEQQRGSILNVASGLIIALALLVLLKIGQEILMPVITALLALFVVNGAVKALARVPVIGALPEIYRGAFVLFAITIMVTLLASMLAGSLQAVIAAAPEYSERLRNVIDALALRFGASGDGLWERLRSGAEQMFNLQSMLGFFIGSLSSIGSLVVMAMLYAFFMLAERPAIPRKIARIFGDKESSDAALDGMEMIVDRVTRYMGLKTLINVVLGVVSYVILKFFGVDFALLWALLIGLFNYIPYIGSYVGVALPVILSIAQFGNIITPGALLICLTGAQVLMGNIVEPKLMGHSLNISPLVILLSLSVWSTLWGIPGAILAVPMTAVIAIVASGIPSMRWIAILIAEDADITLVSEAPMSMTEASR